MQESEPEIPPDRRYNLLCIPWLAVLVLTFPGVLLFPQMFPAGLLRVFGVKETDAIAHGWVAGGWAIYAALTIAACLSGRKRTYFIIYGVLCVLLAINTVGCRVFLAGFREIH